MNTVIAFDSHKRYTFARVENENGKHPKEFRIEHSRGNIAEFLSTQQPGSPVAIETIGNWYWIVDEIEQAGMEPRLVHARKAIEAGMNKLFKETGQHMLLKTMPGTGFL